MSRKSRREQAELQSHPQEKPERSKTKLKVQHIVQPIKIDFKTRAQEDFWNLIGESEITLCSGPAGTGKSYVSIARALNLLYEKSNKYEKIVVCKPAVEADEKLGYLPGSVEEKLDPYIYSSKYIIEKIIGKDKCELLIKNGLLEFKALAYMRGITIDDAIVIAEEMQNTTPRQMKTLLTRIGNNSKFVLSGDLEQSDKYSDYKQSGLFFAMEKLEFLDKIGTFEFEQTDIVRNPIITEILKRFNGDV